MRAEEMWKLYNHECRALQDCPGLHVHPGWEHGTYQAWKFGEEPDRLAELVRSGKKKATSSAHPVYALEGEPLPEEGDYSIILDSGENAVCIIRTSKVRVVPFAKITGEYAWLEGEGDLSLSYWQTVHRSFFAKELASHQLVFDEDMLVVCEEFEVVYPVE